MLKKLVEMVNSAKCFTVLADETTDISTQKQASIGVRYLYNNDIKEEFLQFVPVSDLTGKNLATVILKSLREFGIDTKYLRGQGYDGSAAMSGKFEGAHADVMEERPTAIYFHCVSHSLNLAISASCSISEIRKCCGTATKLCLFFNTPKRMEVITRAIDKLFPEAKSTRLKQLCPTRWVERHDSILLLQEMLPAVQEALEEVSQWKDVELASMASQLLCGLLSSSFIISLQVMARVFSLSLPLARFLQHEHIDLLNAMNMVTNLKGTIEKIRTNAEEEFATIFNASETMAELLSTSIKAPRRTGRQTLRCNIETDNHNPQSYFKISLFLPFLDHFLSELNSRFLKH
ncbi:52 kDa repressor of the inhibitor of the protein kinase-like [Harmonia axyridis]|uniref:52 kDa repressor of the inhibitor of the protein kinase-like n=1 Tax=Harmonia axyridis TaxID=115357 RepID=UPI001E279014|nr:52 kDa repressor of the inhibitor of the protein kinase-like [Harmonia axyridis]